MTMLEGWESEAGNWAAFTRVPGNDRAFESSNLPAFLELLPGPGRMTLDLGCGEGRVGRILQSLGHRVVGLDASPSMVRFAATHEQPELAVLGDARALPFAEGTFDLVVAFMCLQDIDDLLPAVTEVGRVLAPGGRLCAVIPHPVNSAGGFSGREADAPFVITDSYLHPRSLRFTAERDGVRLTFYGEHRPLQAYSEALEAAGLLIEKLREVPASAASAEVDDAPGRWQRIPLSLQLLAVKPG